jgi:PmbA protein
MELEVEREMIRQALAGRDASELYYGVSRQLSIRAFRREIASVAKSESSGIGSRVVRDRRIGTAYSERVDSGETARVLAMAERNSAYPEADPGNVLFEEPSQTEFDARATDLDAVPIETKRALALELESRALAADPRIVNVPHATYAESTGFSVLGNSFGMLQSYAASYCYAVAYVMARDGDETEVGSHLIVDTSFQAIDVDAIVSKAVETALSRLGSIEPATGEYPVVFDRDSASSLLGVFIASGASPFYGENIQKGRSKLAGKVGSRIGSKLFTVIDDPTSGLSPEPFDGDGVATTKRTLVDEGVFAFEVHNLYSATRGGTTSTGHGSRGGFRGGVGVGLHNPYLPNGSISFDELLAETGNGILITDLEGLHSGINVVSGDFSAGAKGFLIKGGRKAAALRNMTVAGNFFEIIGRISATADDRLERTHQSFSAPAIRIDSLSISAS